MQATATITRDADQQFHLKLFIRMGEHAGERVLTSSSCADLAGATAVNLALLLRDSAAHAATQAEQAPTSAPSQASAARQEAPTEGGPTESRQRSPNALRALLQVPRLSLAVGPLPAASLGFSLAGGLALERWRIVAGATLWLPYSAESQRPDTRVHLDRAAASVHVCRSFSLGVIELAPCSSMSLQHLSARGAGPYVRSATAASTWFAFGVGVQAGIHLTSRLNLLAGADVRLQATRPRLAIEGIGTITALSRLAAELFVASEWIL